MAAHVHDIRSKCDNALVAYLISAGAGDEDTIYPAKRALDKETPPYTVIVSTNAKETVPYSGNWMVDVSIETHTNAAPDANESEADLAEDSIDLAGAIRDALMSFGTGEQSGCSLADEISSAAQAAGGLFTALNVRIVEMDGGRTNKQGEWLDTITIQVECVGANI